MITAQDIYKEIKSPEEVEKMEEPPMLKLIYRGIFMCVRLLVDIRANQVKMSKGIEIVPERKEKKKFEGNTVIKSTDNIVIEKKTNG